MGWKCCLIGVLLGWSLAWGVGFSALAQEEPVTQPVGEEEAAEADDLATPAAVEPAENMGQADAEVEPTREEGEQKEGFPAFTPFPYTVVVGGDAVNIRSGPGTKHSIIDRVVRGDLLEVIDEEEGWLRVIVPSGNVGYIYSTLTSLPPSQVQPDVEEAVREHMRQGNLYYYRDDYDTAIDEYRAALDAWPDSSEAHYNLASAYVEKGWYEEAINEYAEALVLKPDHIYSVYNLGWVYFQQGRYEEAAAQWERVTEKFPWYLDGLYNLALAYEMLEDPRTNEGWQRFIEAAEKAGGMEEVVKQVKEHLATEAPE